MANKITTGIVTQSLNQGDRQEQRHQLGLVVNTDDGGEAIYVQANESIDPFGYVLIDDNHKVDYGNTSLAQTNARLRGGWPQVTLKISEFGWVQMSGKPKAKLAASCADNLPLFTTTTDGVLDDASIISALGWVEGARAEVSISNATAVTINVARGQKQSVRP